MPRRRRGTVSIVALSITTMMWYGCNGPKPYYNKAEKDWSSRTAPAAKPTNSIFLIGDAGKSREANPALQLLSSQLAEAGSSGTALFLGNNIYSRGMKDSTDSESSAVKHLMPQLEAVKNHPGPVYFVAGNKDWDNSGTKGYNNVLHQETFIENYLGNTEAFMPGNGCPGPIEVSVDESLTLIFIDTQWWLHENEKSGEDSPCGITTETDFLFLLNDAIRRNVRKKVIVVGHHPMSSTGPHGGKVSPRWHLLPGIGTIYAGYRSMVGNFQDITNTKYRQLSKAVKNVFATHPELIYVSAHDRSLQYQKLGENHQVVSGSGSGTSHVGKRKNTQFAYKHLGFSRINQYEGGELWLEFWVPEEGQTGGKLVYRQQLLKSAAQRQEERAEELASHQYADSTINTIASNGYPVKNFMKRAIFGFNYRKVWSDTVYNIPYFDLATEQGGMSIIKRGGGMQTRSLRMRNNKGEQWVLRSIEKYPESAIPPPLRGTVAGDAVKDMISSSHPYAALVVPPMADAVGVYHTNPKLMYLPSDPRLGTYRQDMAKGLYIYEERAAGNWENQPSFGNSKKLINTLDVIHKTQKNGEQYVDQEQVLRSRLFDVLLGDWDRHDDQWRWAKLKDEDGRTFYRPIPRDRDQAFFWSDGFVLWIGTRKWGMPKFQGFHHKIRDVEGLVYNARFFDRSFLTEMTREQWMNTAADIKKRLTDEVIENAIKTMPESAYKASGEDIVSKLKSRRDDLDKYAEQLYSFLAETVSVVGTRKADQFDVERLNDLETKVTVYRVSKKDRSKKYKLYERVFNRKETKEIRLYGLKGDDHFNVNGDVKKGIKVRIIAGGGKDVVKDDSKVRGWSKKTIVYDKPKGLTLEGGGSEIRDKSANDDQINVYNRMDFQYDILTPLVSFGSNPDDGLFLGGGAMLTLHGFRKEPFASQHIFNANVAYKTGSYSLGYQSTYTDVLGKWDFKFAADIQAPSFTDFFYGLGNESVNDEDLSDEFNQFYRVRYSNWSVHPEFSLQMKDPRHRVELGAIYRSISVTNDDVDEVRFINLFAEARRINEGIRTINVRKHFGAATAQYLFDSRNSRVHPTRGFRFSAGAAGVQQIDDDSLSYVNLGTDASVYLTVGHALKTTLAVRVGGATNLGDFEFYQANFLGGQQNLRGFRRMRFAGKSMAYLNSDLRVKLFDFRTKVFPGSFGVAGIFDMGRVWIENDDSDEIHMGYGGGVWFTPFQAAVISIDYTLNNADNESSVLFIRLGHFF